MRGFCELEDPLSTLDLSASSFIPSVTSLFDYFHPHLGLLKQSLVMQSPQKVALKKSKSCATFVEKVAQKILKSCAKVVRNFVYFSMYNISQNFV